MIVSSLAAACLLLSSQAAARQIPLSSNGSASTSSGVHYPGNDSATQHQHQHEHSQQSTRGLSGRFLHVTDFHPDPHYKVGSAISSGCHSKKPKKDKARAGYWGSPVSGCDSPTHLVEASMDWIKDNWLPSKHADADDPTRSPFDFIIWTGDSARHDLDSKYPRTRKEIYDLNKWSLQLLQSRFPRTPIVPTIGNNDIFPHNILWPGPNDVTSAYSQIWADVIPEYQLHTFQLGGYFTLDVIPGRLAVISMNTIYWYDSNKVVDGCKNAKKRRAKRGRKGKGKAVREASDDGDGGPTTPADDAHATLKSRDPGTIQLEWLEAQLEQYRKRGMHVHLIGHVPPTAGNYFEECYEVYTDIVLHQQQTVIGQHFGHMNVDAFFVQEDSEAVRREDKKKHKNKPRRQGYEGDDDVAKNVTTSLNPSSFSDDLRKDYAIFPGQGRTNASYYHYFFEAPSIVPTYLPSIRVWTYNVSGVTIGEPGVVAADQDETLSDMEALAQTSLSFPPTPRSHFDTLRRKHRRPKHRHRNKVRLPRYTAPDSPVRSNQPLSLLGYSQWVLNLDEANDKQQRVDPAAAAASLALNFGLEYATYTPETLWGDLVSSSAAQDVTTVSTSPRSPAPVPRHLLERELSKRNVHPNDLTTSARHKLPKPIRHLTEYALPHITVDEMLRLARRLAVDDSLWKRFERRVYTESGVED